jgi:hypothetical protein
VLPACLTGVSRAAPRPERPVCTGPRQTNMLWFIFRARLHPSLYCPPRNNPPGQRFRRGLPWGLIALCLGFLAFWGASRATEDVSSQPQGNHVVAADPAIATLLLKAEAQIIAGRTLRPPGDNAMDTWLHVVTIASPASPGVARAFSNFAEDLRNRADAEKLEGRLMVSVDLTVFAGMASEWLTHTTAAPASSRGSQEATSSPVPQSQPAPGPVHAAQEPATRKPPPVVAFASPVPSPASKDLPKADVSPAHTQVLPGQPATSGPSPVTRAAAAVSATRSPTAADEPAPAPAVRPATNTPASPNQSMAEFYARRGEEMLAIKDISAARKYYEYAANAGSARAAMAIARTYDPTFLSLWQTIGPRPDPALAAVWYRRAAALGDPIAAAWLRAQH